jgi:AcrR family transcriptional regulator
MSTSRKDRKETQRERLLDGMLLAVVRRGYEGASVAQAIAHAGVSRPTFYEYFTDKDDCFLTVHREISEQLFERVSEAVDAEPPERAVQAGVRALILRAEARPDRARFLVNETLAGGPRVLDEHDRTVERIEQIIEQARAKASPDASTPDLPTRALVGGICGLLAPRLRRNEHDLRKLADQITSWIDGYCQPTKHHRWRTLDPGPVLSPLENVSELALRIPPTLPPGRPTLSSAEVARNQRERILYATAAVAARKGYAAATISDITATACVDRRVFYTNFRDKQHAFLAVHEFGFQQMMAACTSAFFGADSWPERIWDGILAGSHFDATYPVLAHIGYVESYAVGHPAIQRVEDSHAAFKIFLQEGCTLTDTPPSRTVLDVIAATIFEIGYRHARQRQIQQLPRLTPHAVYLVLTPFLGRGATNDFIDEQLRREEQRPIRSIGRREPTGAVADRDRQRSVETFGAVSTGT